MKALIPMKSQEVMVRLEESNLAQTQIIRRSYAYFVEKKWRKLMIQTRYNNMCERLRCKYQINLNEKIIQLFASILH